LQTASLVFDLNRFTWSDTAWIEHRNSKQWHKEPISIYEVHLGSWREYRKKTSIPQLTGNLVTGSFLMSKDNGFTHMN